jgi:hypothetical protein
MHNDMALVMRSRLRRSYLSDICTTSSSQRLDASATLDLPQQPPAYVMRFPCADRHGNELRILLD